MSRVKTTLQDFHATRGQFTYEDHEAPWTIVAPNIDLVIRKGVQYQGEASVSGGTVRIHDYLPMWTNMKARFVIADGRIRLGRIDLDSDGAQTVAVGEVDPSHWPEMKYR